MIRAGIGIRSAGIGPHQTSRPNTAATAVRQTAIRSRSHGAAARRTDTAQRRGPATAAQTRIATPNRITD